MRGATAACLVILLAGCLAPAPLRTASVSPPTAAEPLWSDAARIFQVPTGDSYGAILKTFTDERPATLFGGPTFGLQVNQSGMPPGSRVLVHAFKVERGTAVLSSSSAGSAGNVEAVGEGSSNDTTMLLLLSIHTPAPGSIAVSEWMGSQDDWFPMPRANVSGTWLASGPVQVSYFESFPSLDPSNVVHGQVEKYGVEEQQVGTCCGALLAGHEGLSTAHPAKSPGGFEVTEGVVLPAAAGAGVATFAWTNGANATRATLPLVSAQVGLVPVFFETGPTEGDASLVLDTYGTAALPFIILEHTSVPFDTEPFGFHIEPLHATSAILDHGCLKLAPEARCAQAFMPAPS